jgi:hypothetical protein
VLRGAEVIATAGPLSRQRGQRAGGAPRHRLPQPELARIGPRDHRRPRSGRCGRRGTRRRRHRDPGGWLTERKVALQDDVFSLERDEQGTLHGPRIYPVGAENDVTAVDLVFPVGRGIINLGIRSRRRSRFGHRGFLCHYGSPIWRFSECSAGSLCSPGPTVPRTPRSCGCRE